MGEMVFRAISGLAMIFAGMAIWLYVLVASVDDSQYTWVSGDVEAAALIDPTSGRNHDQAKRNNFFQVRLSPSATCPVVISNPDQIDRTIGSIRELLLTEAKAEQVALADIRAGNAKVYISLLGAGPITCSLANSMKERGVTVSLLGKYPNDPYWEFYVAKYNATVMKMIATTTLG